MNVSLVHTPPRKAFLDATQDESHRNGVCIEMDAFVICLYFRSNYRGIQVCLDMHAIRHKIGTNSYFHPDG